MKEHKLTVCRHRNIELWRADFHTHSVGTLGARLNGARRVV